MNNFKSELEKNLRSQPPAHLKEMLHRRMLQETIQHNLKKEERMRVAFRMAILFFCTVCTLFFIVYSRSLFKLDFQGIYTVLGIALAVCLLFFANFLQNAMAFLFSFRNNSVATSGKGAN